MSSRIEKAKLLKEISNLELKMAEKYSDYIKDIYKLSSEITSLKSESHYYKYELARSMMEQIQLLELINTLRK